MGISTVDADSESVRADAINFQILIKGSASARTRLAFLFSSHPILSAIMAHALVVRVAPSAVSADVIRRIIIAARSNIFSNTWIGA